MSERRDKSYVLRRISILMNAGIFKLDNEVIYDF